MTQQLNIEKCPVLERDQSIGSTIIGQVMGTSLYGDAWNAYLILTGQADDFEITQMMQRGQLAEPFMIGRANEILKEDPQTFGVTADEVQEFNLRFVPCDTISATVNDVPCRSTPDAVLVFGHGSCGLDRYQVNHGSVYLECKLRFWSDNDLYEDGPPASDYDQCQWHMMLGGGSTCYVVAWFGMARDIEIFRLDRDDKRIAECINAAFDFVYMNILTSTPPEVTGSTACTEYLKRQEEEDGSSRPFEGDEWALACEDDELRLKIEEMKERRQVVRNLLRESMGETQRLYVDGSKSKVSFKKTKKGTRPLTVTIKD